MSNQSEAKAYQFKLAAKKLTSGTVRYGNNEELLCNTVYLKKGAMHLMQEVFPNGEYPPGIIVTIQADPSASVDMAKLLEATTE